jgi:hypothetical protein
MTFPGFASSARFVLVVLVGIISVAGASAQRRLSTQNAQDSVRPDQYVLPPASLKIALAALDSLDRGNPDVIIDYSRFHVSSAGSISAYVRAHPSAESRILNSLSTEQWRHIYDCYAQKGRKFWPPSFRIEQVRRWRPAIRLIEMLPDQDSAIVDMGGYPVVYKTPDVARVIEGSEFTEKRFLKVVRSVRFIPTDKVGSWFALPLAGQERVTVRRIETGRSIKGKTNDDRQTDVVGNRSKTSIQQDKNQSISTDTVERIRTVDVSTYAEATAFVVSPETAEDTKQRLKQSKSLGTPAPDPEKLAKSSLRLIEQLLEDPRKREAAKFRLQQLIEKYPDTEAAKRAKDLLDQLRN